MKLLFTFIFTCLLSATMMGQQDYKELKKFDTRKQHKNFSTVENRIARNPDYVRSRLQEHYIKRQNTVMKSETAEKQELDSLLYEAYIPASSEWIVIGKDIFTYDAKGNMILYVSYDLDTATMIFVPTLKEELTFDIQGNLTEYLLYEWDTSKAAWVPSGKYEDFFDGNGNLVKEVFYSWDTIANEYVTEVQYEMTYDGQGNITLERSSYWDEDTSLWIPFWKIEYNYTDGKLMSILESFWDADGSQWIIAYRSDYVYDAGGNMTSEIEQVWDFQNIKWLNETQWEYSYDAQGNQTLELESDWDEDNLLWIYAWQYEYTYDGDGNMTEEVDSWWDGLKWVSDWRGVWTYNKNYSYTDLLVPYWFVSGPADMTFIHMPLSLTEFDPVLATWILAWRQMAYYSAFQTTSVDELAGSGIGIFPNPATDHLTVTWEDSQTQLNLELYDLTGKSVLNRSVSNHETLRIEHLSEGLYLYRLSDKKNILYTGKVSIK